MGVRFEIVNDEVPPNPVTVFLVPETGNRRRLGSVQPGGRQTFTYDPGIRDQDFRLTADVAGADDRRSQTFDLSGVTRVQWSVRDPTVRVFR